MTMLRIGVIGAGNMGTDHVKTVHGYVAGADVTAVADIDAARARSAAALAGARPTEDAYGLIADPEVDAVVIASDDATHADLAVATLRAGKPVMCEKPLAPTLDECLRVVTEEREAGGAYYRSGLCDVLTRPTWS